MEHKTKKHIGVKAVPLGKDEQKILEKYLKGKSPESPLFLNNRGKAISRESYDRTIQETIEKHKLKKFTPYQIRHTSLTKVSLEHGRDVARAVAGHTTDKMTSRYDHSDLDKAFRVTKERNKKYRSEKIVGDSRGTDIPIFRIYTGE
jgi:integrase